MGVDVRAFTMYGIEVDSLEDAVDVLLTAEAITEEEGKEAIENGEIPGEFNFEMYSYYSSENEGVLGICARVEYALDNPGELKSRMRYVDSVLKGATWHEFCRWL